MQYIQKNRVMIFGADVNHARVGSMRPSFAAVTGSLDADARKHAAVLQAQSPRLEIIQVGREWREGGREGGREGRGCVYMSQNLSPSSTAKLIDIFASTHVPFLPSPPSSLAPSLAPSLRTCPTWSRSSFSSSTAPPSPSLIASSFIATVSPKASSRRCCSTRYVLPSLPPSLPSSLPRVMLIEMTDPSLPPSLPTCARHQGRLHPNQPQV